MWNAFFGQFDILEKWEFDWEQEFLHEHNWRYLEPIDIDQKKGYRKKCVSRLIRQAKVNIVKRLNDASKETHKCVIGMKRNNAKKQSDPDFKPRQLAQFQYDDFVKTRKVCPARCIIHFV